MPAIRLTPADLARITRQPDYVVTHNTGENPTPFNQQLVKAHRTKLQDAFYYGWIACGGAPNFWQQEYQFADGRRYRFDFANIERKVAVEVNGGQWAKSGHTSGKGVQRDAEKLNLAQSLDWTVFVLTTSMLHKRHYREHIERILKHCQSAA